MGKSIFDWVKKIHGKFRKTDWANPKNTLILVALIALPFVAWYYVSTGFVIGLLMSICILWLLEKSPVVLKHLVARFPFAADVILSSTVVFMFGSYFGSGLTLGIAAVCTAVILSWGLEVFSSNFKREREQYRNEKAATA